MHYVHFGILYFFSSYFFSSTYNLILKQQIEKHWLDHPSLLLMSSVKSSVTNLCIP